MPLRQIIYGFIPVKARPKRVPVVSDNQGRVYLPNLGTLMIQAPNIQAELGWDWSYAAFSVWINGQKQAAVFEKPIYIPGTGIEVLQSNPAYFQPLFNDMERSGEQTSAMNDDATHKSPYLGRLGELQTAFSLLKTCLPEFYRQVRLVANAVMVLEDPTVRSFASPFAFGVAFISSAPANRDRVVFYLTELIHQFGHCMLHAIMPIDSDYFQADSGDPMAKYNGNPTEQRTLYSALHGLYTTAKTAECFDALCQNNALSEAQRYEVVARLADNKRRFRTGLEKINFAQIFTAQGLALYQYLDELCAAVYERLDPLIAGYDVSNQRFVFSMNRFYEANPGYPRA